MLVKPAPGLKIRHPVTKQLHSHEDEEPLTVDERDPFWAKLLEHGDVVAVKAED